MLIRLPHFLVFVEGDDPNDPDKTGGSGTKTFTQEEVNAVASREKQQGQRAGQTEILTKLGFDSVEAAEQFVNDQREAEKAKMSEAERREQAANERERQAQAREDQAAQRERNANIRAALVEQGAQGDDLNDAAVLLVGQLADDADEDAIRTAAQQLAERRAELFGGQGGDENPRRPVAPIPSGGGQRQPNKPSGKKPGEAGLERARRRGWLKDKD